MDPICRNPLCGLRHNPGLRCDDPRVTGAVTVVTDAVTPTGNVTIGKVTPVVTVDDAIREMRRLVKPSCAMCAAKDAEILRLRAEIAGMEKPKSKGKRDRAEYMRAYRARV